MLQPSPRNCKDRAPDLQRPVVCFDESPYQIISETRQVIPAQPGRRERHDMEYRREGTCNLFLFLSPTTGWRHVQVTPQRTARDFAYQMQAVVDVHFPDAPVIRLVVDNLNTHTVAALDETFPAPEARRIARRLEWHFTPKHGSWFNMAEMEFSVMLRQCLDRRFASAAAVAHEIACWEGTRNAQRASIAWRFSSGQARVKLRRLYPSSS
jgi:hypothetical protein